MDTLYDMTIEIGGYNKSRVKPIKDACMVEWNFRDEDFIQVPGNDGTSRLLQAEALGAISEGEDIDEIINRMERSIWRANNGKLCHIEVTASVVTMKTSHNTQAAA